MTQQGWRDDQRCLSRDPISKLATLSLAQFEGAIADKAARGEMTTGLSIVLVIATTTWTGFAKPAAAQPLPPPPDNAVPFGQFPTASPASASYTVPRELDFQAPPSASAGTVAANAAPGERYLVFVNSSSPGTLQQVRQIEPQAFVRNYNGQRVVQAGSFSSQANANLMAATLQGQGLNAQVALPQSAIGGSLPTPALPEPQAGSFSTPQSFPFGQTSLSNPPYTGPNPIGNPTFSQPGTVSQAGTASFFQTPMMNGQREVGYYVVIPASAGDLATIQQQIVGLGVPAESVRPRGVPRGPHISVGPFESRSLADSWNRYLRNFGLDARVYYGR